MEGSALPIGASTSPTRVAYATVLTVTSWILLVIIIVFPGHLGGLLMHVAVSIVVAGWRGTRVHGLMIITWPVHDIIEAQTVTLLALPQLFLLTTALALGSKTGIGLLIVIFFPTPVVLLASRSAILILHARHAGVFVHLLLSIPCILSRT